MTKIRVGIIGGTGYTGVELIRLLLTHSQVQINAITSRSESGKAVAELFPTLRGLCSLTFSDPDQFDYEQCDVVFCATPNGIAMQHAPDLIAAGVRVIDLSADFRLTEQSVWEKWYGMQHMCPELLTESVYGLPEINRKQLATAQLVANPGCYPTAIQLGFTPLLEHSLVDTTTLIADAKSGVSGAGRNGAIANAMCEVNESFKAYAASGHRHLPEIIQQLSLIAEHQVSLTFTPHLIPMSRGILATLYARLVNPEIDDQSLQDIFEQRYANEAFVDVMSFASHPETRSVRGSNMCRMAVHRPQGSDTVVVIVVEDNLVKGAAGQAVQNMNIMFSQAETCGLAQIALIP